MVCAARNSLHQPDTLQIIQALQAPGKRLEVQIGPEKGHFSIRRERMMEFFIENLVLKCAPAEP